MISRVTIVIVIQIVPANWYEPTELMGGIRTTVYKTVLPDWVGLGVLSSVNLFAPPKSAPNNEMDQRDGPCKITDIVPS